MEEGGSPLRDWIDTLMNEGEREKHYQVCIDCCESESSEECRVAFRRRADKGVEKLGRKSSDPREAIMSSAMPRNCLRFESTSVSATEEQRPGLNGSRDNLGETNLLRRERNESARL